MFLLLQIIQYESETPFRENVAKDPVPQTFVNNYKKNRGISSRTKIIPLFPNEGTRYTEEWMQDVVEAYRQKNSDDNASSYPI